MENKFSCIILVSSLFSSFVEAQLAPFEFESPTLGKMRGSIGSTFNLDPYYQFQGIPFAQVQRLGRFLPSAVRIGKLPGGSDGYFDARRRGAACVQPAAVLSKDSNSFHYGTLHGFISAGGEMENRSSGRAASGSEDCLYINIFTRNVPTPEIPRSAPVIVFIHGGAFIAGSANYYEGHRFLEEDVVLVTFNYRLGVLGFFSLDAPEAPGNAALYDMLSALVWIQSHIADFGGDPNSVTVIGQSAGAAALIHLIASPLVANPVPLFHKGIVLSGSGTNEWGQATASRGRAASLRIAELVGCYTPVGGLSPDTVAITACMVALEDMDLLMEKMLEYQAEEQYAGRLGFDATVPVIQTATSGTLRRLIEEDPQDVFEGGRELPIPLMMGAMSHDGSFPLGVLYNKYLLPHSYHNNSDYLKEDMIPDVLRAFGIVDDSNAVADAIAKTYLGDTRHSGMFSEMMPGLIDLHSVFFFKADIYRILQLHAEVVGSSYWYSFDYKGPKSLFPLLFIATTLPPIYGGVSHGDDMLYLFAIPLFHLLNAEEMGISHQLITYYVNFARTGDPNPSENEGNLVHWPKYEPIHQKYLSINVTFVEKAEYPLSWESAADILIPPPPTVSTLPTTESTQDPNVPTAGSTTPPPITTNSTNNHSHTVVKLLFILSVVIAGLCIS